ncbi:hydroxymethylbilane synthase [Ichthyobacterium seriolicida]|uniref:Hydroxymethylbilane synthase n=1 Tax=Ichthyobacterium seriolicida TaxID=242600 RepID=A0A1J1ECW4_9FLAO|nr:hydroxymethylbilane synthase [Ichthyobacterium seriolicida]BAV95352.1 porphobilinogen deaminase [Ichthyobacterium seriolicida]
MGKKIRLGTRSSQLAMYQARLVEQKIREFGCEIEIVPIKSTGDLILDTPIYDLNIVGVFTKSLDIALLNNDIDIAVHSMKDVPTSLPQGIVQGAVLKRGNTRDALVYADDDILNNFDKKINIATGSLRRKAFWKNKYPNHIIHDLRGNVNNRLKEIQKPNIDAAIFAEVGLKRINILPEKHIILDWMIPAPAQGAIMITCRKGETQILDIIKEINCEKTNLCVGIERDFLSGLEGGCTAPIGAIAELKDESIHFKGALLDRDGNKKIYIERVFSIRDSSNMGFKLATECLERGGDKIMSELNKLL